MRAAALALLLPLAACSSSREPASGGSYAVEEAADGSVQIQVSEGASPEVLMAALGEAADLLEWTPPEAAAGLRMVESRPYGDDDTGYRYDLADGRFDVYVYRYGLSADEQVDETLNAMRQLVDEGRLDAFEKTDEQRQAVEWEGAEAVLHRVVFQQTLRGKPTDSYMYLLQDGAWWVKVRASFAAGRYTPETLDEMVRALLAGGTR